MPETLYRSAQPTLEVAGQTQAVLAEGLLRLEVHEHSAGLYRLEANFGNWGAKDGRVDFLYFDRRTLDFGKAFTVKLGDDTVFDGRITALEATFPQGQPPTLAVLAEDRLQDLRMTRRSRSFESVSDEDVFNAVAQEHGLGAEVSLPGPSHRVLAQVNQSDLAFLRERARAIGAEVWVEGSTLRAAPRRSRGRPTLELAYQGKLHEFTVLADLSQQCSKLVVGGWDVSGKRAIQEEADESAVQSELEGAQSGAALLRSALGERVQSLAHTVPLDAQQAQAEAEAGFRTLARRFLMGRGVADPDGRLRVGATVRLRGLGPLFSGSYYLSETTYRFDRAKGSRLEFTAERPGLGQG